MQLSAFQPTPDLLADPQSLDVFAYGDDPADCLMS
jgi:hypothetical protein